MSAPQPDSAPAPAPPSAVVPLILWLAAQLMALAVARFPLSGNYPHPPESQALSVMLAAQLAAAALLFPLLLRTPGAAAISLAASWPFSILAAVLAGQSVPAVAAGMLYLSVWLAALAAWRYVLRFPYLHTMGVAIVSAISFGGVLLAYLRAEFEPMRPPGWIDTLRGPFYEGLALLAHPSLSTVRFAWLLAFAAISAGAAGAAAVRRRSNPVRA